MKKHGDENIFHIQLVGTTNEILLLGFSSQDARPVCAFRERNNSLLISKKCCNLTELNGVKFRIIYDY